MFVFRVSFRLSLVFYHRGFIHARLSCVTLALAGLSCFVPQSQAILTIDFLNHCRYYRQWRDAKSQQTVSTSHTSVMCEPWHVVKFGCTQKLIDTIMLLTEQSPEELHREREELKKTLIRKVTPPTSRISAVKLWLLWLLFIIMMQCKEVLLLVMWYLLPNMNLSVLQDIK